KPQQQQSSQAKPSSSKRLLALAFLLLLIAVITIVILLGLLASRSCDNGASESDGLQSRRSPKSLTRAVYLDESGKSLPAPGHPVAEIAVAHQLPTADAIIFHVGAGIRISDLTVTAAQRLDEVSRQRCPSLDLLYIRVSRQCTTGELLNVSLSFEREIEGDKLDGFYMAKYKDKNRALRYMASTHMEPVSARKAFPCFDEPEMKATFDLEVIRDWRYKSLFNMPLARTVPDTRCSHLTNQSGCHRDIFQTSVVMSTYLVAYAVLPMDYVSLQKVVKTSRGSIQVGIWAPSSSQNQLDFAMSVTEKVLPYFEDLFNLSYPLPKLDMIGVPQFAAGAMENWGLIIYRFSTLLYDPNYTTTIDKQTIAEVISHEIAHQWFGNIVTMKWWDELWLNEAFAVFTQYIGVDAFKPGWSMMDRCYVEFVASALQTDSLLHSHPIIVPGLSDPNEIESMFDDISYFKGSALIRMLDAVIGRRTLKRGLIIYLNRFAWRNAASSDLFAAFSEAYMLENGDSGPHANSPVRNLTRVMDTWTTQVNYPLVTVRIRGNKLHFRQERFLLVPNATSIWKSNQTRCESDCRVELKIGPMIAGDQQAMTDLSKFIVKILNRPLRNILSKKEAELTHME
uniref:Peptidase_M1 domain-containing protein n=1 Tax=Macrostomum lignano TaxID=282301 RepID=A0A1I8IWC6_9PLAT